MLTITSKKKHIFLMTFYFKVKIIYLLKHYYKKNHLKAILFIQSYVYFNCEKSIKSSKNGHIKFLKLLVNCCGKKYILYLKFVTISI